MGMGGADEVRQAPSASVGSIVLEPGELRRPDTAWPTVLLAIFGIASYTSIAVIGIHRGWGLLLTLPMSVLAAYVIFTPFHESTHGSVSCKHRWLNDVVGWICGAPFVFVPYSIFRWIHLQHHKHTNDQEHDPDHSEWQNPLLFAAAVLPNYVRHIRKNAGSIPRSTFVSSAAQLCLVTAVFAVGTWYGMGGYLRQYALYPALIAPVFIGLVFDYVPHYPHKTARKDDPFGCTGVVDGVVSLGSGGSSWWLSVLLCGQNFHAIHHLYPTVPFYSYSKIWRNHQRAFLQAGVPLVSLWH